LTIGSSPLVCKIPSPPRAASFHGRSPFSFPIFVKIFFFDFFDF
jgi:hypothetical protein